MLGLTRRCWKLWLAAVLLGTLQMQGAGAAPLTRVLEDAQGKLVGWPSAVKVVPEGQDGNLVLRWQTTATSGPQALNFSYRDRGVEAGEWDRLVFDYRFEQDACTWWGIKLVDHPLGDGMQATWQITTPEATRAGAWRTAVIDLRHPTWLWGDKPDLQGQYIAFRCLMADGKQTAILLDNIRLERDAMHLTVTKSGSPAREGDLLTLTYEASLKNNTDAPLPVRFGTRDAAPALKVQVTPEALTLAPGETRPVKVKLALAAAGKEALPPLTTLSALFYARSEGEDRQERNAPLSLTVPLGKLPHPFALLRREDVPRILKNVEQSPEAKEVYTSLKARADGWLQRTPEYPDRGSQWWHWYSCKACGGKLRTQSPTQHVCVDCGKSYTGWPYDDVVLDRQHGALSNAIRDLGVMYTLTGERAYADKAKQILLGYAERYLTYPLHDINGKPGKGGGHVGPQTLDESTWLIPVAQGFDCIYDTLTEAEVKTIADKMLLPAARLIHEHQWGIHNICCWHDSAYGLVGLVLGDEQLAADSIYGPKGFLAQVEKGVSDDGPWYEGAWGYHYYTMSALHPLAVAAHNIGINLYSDRYRGMYEAPLKFMAPGGQLPAFNDSAPAWALGSGNLYEVAYARWKEPVLLLPALRAKRNNLEALLYGVPLNETPRFALQSAIFPAAGFAILRSGPLGTGDADQHIPQNYLALDFGPHGGGHGHPDKLAFALYGQGKLLAEDPGCIAYGNPAHPGWFKQTLSHNTVVVDGRSQQACTGELQFHAFSSDAGFFSARADTAYPGVRLRRAMALIGDRVLDLFLCESNAEHTFDWAFHNRGAFRTALPLTKLDAAPKGDGYSWGKDWQQADAPAAWGAEWRLENGPGVVLAQAAADGPRQVLTAVGMGNPTSIKAPFVISRQRGKEAVYASALECFSGESAPALSVRLLPVEGATPGRERPLALEASGNGVRDILLINPQGGTVRIGDLTLNGRGVLIRYRGAQVERVVLADGARVSQGGMALQAR